MNPLRAIAPLVRLYQLAYFKWARAEMAATHPDLPYVVVRINELESTL